MIPDKIFDLMHRYRNDGSCERQIYDALDRLGWIQRSVPLILMYLPNIETGQPYRVYKNIDSNTNKELGRGDSLDDAIDAARKEGS